MNRRNKQRALTLQRDELAQHICDGQVKHNEWQIENKIKKYKNIAASPKTTSCNRRQKSLRLYCVRIIVCLLK